MKVYLSPSDQWSNLTAISGVSEAKQCAMIAEYAKTALEEYGITAYVGDNSKIKTYPNRAKESNHLGVDYHICIHTNAGGGTGTLVMTYPTTVNDKTVISVYNHVASLTPSVDKGIQPRTDLYEINKTKATCIYIEVDFHDNAETENWIYANMQNIGQAIADGVAEAAGCKKHVASGTLYLVQFGAYKRQTNADNMLHQIQLLVTEENIFIKLENDGYYHVQAGPFKDEQSAERCKKLAKDLGFSAIIKRK